VEVVSLCADGSRASGCTGARTELKVCFVFFVDLYSHALHVERARMNDSLDCTLAFAACKFRELRKSTMKYMSVKDCINNDVHPKDDIIKSIIRECLREMFTQTCCH